MIITETKVGFEVAFKYDPVKVSGIKNIAGSYWNQTKRVWVVSKRKKTELQNLVARTMKVEPGDYSSMPVALETAVPQAFIPQINGEIPELPDLKMEIPLARPLFPFQARGAAYCIEKKRVIIGDQPGLGKTSQAIAAIVAANAFPCLVICPATLKLNWQKEWSIVAGKKAMVLNDRIKTTWPQYHRVGMVDIIITNYESLKKYFVQAIHKTPDEILKLKHVVFKESINLFKSVIIDEVHKCKDGSTQQCKFTMGITKGKEYVLALTGTPVVNKPKDLISQLHIINKLSELMSHIPVTTSGNGRKDLSGYSRFLNRYCGGYNEASNLKELNYRLNMTCFYRREKSEVLKDLPAKIRQVVLCEITNRPEYEKAENEFVQYLKEVKGCTDAQIKKKLKGEIMVKMGILKGISARGKIAAVREHIDEIIEGGEKVGLFCYLRENIQAFKELYPQAVTIYGADSIEQRDSNVTAFQNNPECNVIVCNYKSGGVGLTLTAASRMAFLEFPWTFADCEQCEDRFHRIGQQDSVQCLYFLGENTIDRYCYDIIQKKKAIAMDVTGASDDVEEEMIDQLINLFNQK